METNHTQYEHGHGLRAAVTQRRQELELRLAELQNSDQQGTAAPEAIESALAHLDALLPSDGAEISPVVGEQLTRWIDTNRYLGATPLDAPKRGARRFQAGKIGWALLWLLGVPLPVLLIIYLIRGH